MPRWLSRSCPPILSARSLQNRGRILEDAEIKPHRVKMWCHSDDPAYQEKMRAIVDLYINLPKGEPVLSIDEKTGMPALSRRRPLQPVASRRDARFDFEYKRNSTAVALCFTIRQRTARG